MKKIGAVLALLLFINTSSQAQRACGMGYLLNKLSVENPAKMQQLLAQRDQMIKDAMASEADNSTHKTAATYPIPLVFHFVLTSTEYGSLGGDTGIKRRVFSQVASLNRDYMGTNTDKTKVPAAFLSVFGTVGLSFGVANVTTANTIAPGIELKIVPKSTTFSVSNYCSDAKHTTNGLAALDNSKYLNVWVNNITTTGGGTILGVTVPPSIVGIGGFPTDEMGIVLTTALLVHASTAPNLLFQALIRAVRLPTRWVTTLSCGMCGVMMAASALPMAVRTMVSAILLHRLMLLTATTMSALLSPSWTPAARRATVSCS
jgi:hypothetical protein